MPRKSKRRLYYKPNTRSGRIRFRIQLEQLGPQVAECLLLAKAQWLRAEQAQKIREGLLAKTIKIFDELYALRNAKDLSREGQVHVYRALAAFARVNNAILSDASLDEIQGMLEDGEDAVAEISQTQRTQTTSGKESRRKVGPYA